MTPYAQPMRGQLVLAPEPVEDLPSLRCRRLSPADAAPLGHLMASAYRGSVDDAGETPEWHAAEAEASLAGRYGEVVWTACFAAEDADRTLIGVSVVTADREHLLLAFLLVDPTCQGCGVGTHLLRRSASALRGDGHSEWTLAVTLGNPAQGLYERHGFVVDESLRTGD